MRAPVTGERWERRRLLGSTVIVAALLLGIMPIAFADTPASDVPCAIGDGQYKYDVEEGVWTPEEPTGVTLVIVWDEDNEADSITVPEGWIIVCAFGGGEKVFPDARTVDMDKAISHIVIAMDRQETTPTTPTTAPPTTDTSAPATTVTTAPPSTDTSIASTSTSTAPPSTDTSAPATTVTTAPPSTDTSAPATTVTTVSTTSEPQQTRFACDVETAVVVEVSPGDAGYEDAVDTEEEAANIPACLPPEVQPTVVTTAPEVDPEDELPFTGIDTDVMIGLSLLFLALGAVLLTVTRRLEEN